jgi:hypothetical protein
VPFVIGFETSKLFLLLFVAVWFSPILELVASLLKQGRAGRGSQAVPEKQKYLLRLNF